MIGDPKQLPTTVKSKNKNTDDHLENPFADQIQTGIMTRLQKLGFRMPMFIEQWRLTEGLEEFSNIQFYGGKLRNASCTKLSNRPKAREASHWIEETFGIATATPHVCLNVSPAATMTTRFMSRYNLHNIVVATHYIKAILKAGLFDQQGILVIVPYRAQAARYRELFRRLKLGSITIAVATIDASQGLEFDCVLFDLVVSSFRTSPVGFVRAPERINVAMTRAKYMQITICDLSALNDTKYLKWFSQQDEETQAASMAVKSEQNKYLQALFDFYQARNVTCLVRPKDLIEEFNFMDMTEAEEALAQMKIEDDKSRCKRCGSIVHRASNCDQPQRLKCKLCRGWDHIKADCDQVVCKRCGKKGHMVPGCSEPDPRPCGNCGEIGHPKKECRHKKMKRLRFTVPSQAQNTTIKPINPKLDDPTQAADTPAIAQWDAGILEQIEKDVAKVDPAKLAEDIAAEEKSATEGVDDEEKKIEGGKVEVAEEQTEDGRVEVAEEHTEDGKVDDGKLEDASEARMFDPNDPLSKPDDEADEIGGNNG